jgi:MSHA biogenesis protein MshP
MSPSRARGFAAPLAVFIIVMGLALAGAVAMLSGTQQAGIAVDVQGARAYQAARAGLEWGVHHVLRAGGEDCASIDGDTFSPGGGLSDFRVTLSCTQSTHTGGTAAITMYAIAANACTVAAGNCPLTTPASPGYAERELRVTVGSE